jgi:2-polyprenyl-3-methyl-5-hydroxy-6-metoxy-1,4-benzoquinol methylase
MRIQFIQDLIDTARGKKRARTIPVSPVDADRTEVDALFERFEHREVEFNGRRRKYLSGVNADPGVTEQTLSLLCQQFSGDRHDIKVLNVGCGKKNQSAFLQSLGFDAYGVDFDIDVDTDKFRFHDLNTQDDLPFDGAVFDCVICQEIIEHIENPWLLFRKVKKALKVGGALIVTTPNISSNNSKKIFTENNVGFYAYFDPANLWQHINPIAYWEMIHIATFNGFEPIRLTGNNEFYARYLARKRPLTPDLETQITIQNNDILHYVFRNLNTEIRLYSPVPTHSYVWPATQR